MRIYERLQVLNTETPFEVKAPLEPSKFLIYENPKSFDNTKLFSATIS
jgi:hypothetical protein